jgi:putative Holliday junction resolvase
MGRIVGIDFGEKRTGVAATDPLRIIANGIDTIPTEKIYDFLQQYVAKEKVDLFVVGMPKTLQSELAVVATKVNAFIEKLQQLFPTIPIETIDERFTSVLAQRAMIDGGLKKKARQNKALIDKISATIILQSYLEQNKFNLKTDFLPPKKKKFYALS